MTFATATINSPTPAKDLMAALNAPLTAGGLTFVESYGTPPVTTNWTSVCFGGGQYVAVATNTATAATSPDGITWTQRLLPASQTWQSVTYGGGLFVAVASSSAMAATSADGVTWTLRGLPAVASWFAVTYGGGMFVVVTSGQNVAASSPDGINWTQRTLPIGGAWTVTYGNSMFVAVNSQGVAATAAASSPDGITWTTRAMANGSPWTSVTWGGTLFVAVCNTVAVANTSPDGITWTSQTIPTGGWVSVTYGNSLYVAVSSTQVVSSANGIAWGTARTLPAAQGWTSVAYGTGGFVTVPSSTAATALVSPDAQTWTARNLTNTSASATADVYKSPAASNQLGQDWYLILRRSDDYNTSLFYQVAEGYNATTHRASNYGGTTLAVAPAVTTFANPAVAAAPETIAAGSAALVLTAGTSFTYWVSASANRVVLGVKTSTEVGFYAGLYDDLLPAGTTQFPLVCARIPVNQSSTGAIGGGGAAGNGGFTREPGQVASLNLNFEARIHNGWVVGNVLVIPGGFTPSTSAGALYGNPCATTRVMIGSARTTTNIADAVRGLLIGCVSSSVLSVIGDVITSNGKTYARIAGPTTSYGIFADTTL